MPIEPGSPEWIARVKTLLAEEQAEPVQWWYMSYAAADKGFVGACIVRARGPVGAMLEAHRLRINPGGEVMYFPIGQKPEHPVNCLLTREQLGDDAKTVGQLEDEGILPGSNVGFHEH